MMDRDIERVIRGLFAAYRVFKRIRKIHQTQTKDKPVPVRAVSTFPGYMPGGKKRGLGPMDAAIASERARGRVR